MNDPLQQQRNAVKWLRIIYPAWAIVGIFSLMYVPTELIVKGNPELSIANIVDNEFLFRVGIAGSLITQLFSVAAVWLLFKLFYQSFKDATILMAAFAFLGIPIAMHSTANQLAVFDVITDVEQAYLLLRLNSRGTTIATIFWGLWLFPQAYMIMKSPLFPRFLGWFMILAGVGYTVSAFGYFLNVEGLIMDIVAQLTLGEVVWMLWVMIMGARWERAKSTHLG